VSHLPSGFEGDHDLPAEPSRRGGLERRRSFELTPAERAIAKKNRRWLMTIALPTLVVGTIGILVSLYAATRGQTVTPSAVPAGYKSVPDGYFAYAVPSTWTTSILFSDYAGDLYNGEQSSWAAENLGTRLNPPTPGEAQPSSFKSFGQNVPTAYQLGPARLISVAGATVTYEYRMTRPGGFEATAVDAWESHTGAELWLLIHASPATTAEILGTLKG
jgi:hypothetical protein